VLLESRRYRVPEGGARSGGRPRAGPADLRTPANAHGRPTRRKPVAGQWGRLPWDPAHAL